MFWSSTLMQENLIIWVYVTSGDIVGLEDQLVFHVWKSSYTGLVTQTGLIQTCAQTKAVKASHRSVTKNCIFLTIIMYLLGTPSYEKHAGN